MRADRGSCVHLETGRFRVLDTAMVTRQASELPTRPQRQHLSAWMLAAAAVVVGGGTGTWLAGAGVRAGVAMTLSFYLGVAGGIAWQVLNRRDLVDRLLWWAVFISAVMLLPALPGGDNASAADAVGAWSYPGVIVGLLLAEGWMRKRKRP